MTDKPTSGSMEELEGALWAEILGVGTFDLEKQKAIKAAIDALLSAALRSRDEAHSADVATLKAEVERLRGVVEAAKILDSTISDVVSETTADDSAYHVPESAWISLSVASAHLGVTLRAALDAKEPKEGGPK